MAQKRMTATDIVREYADKYKEMPTAKLASLIFNQNKKFFSTQENVRTMLRQVRGKAGSQSAKMDAHRKETTVRPTNPYSLPKGLSEKVEPFNIPGGHNNILVISDIHAPFHDEKALKLAVKYGKEQKVNCVLINGDLVDFYAISSFQTDPRKRDLKNEIDTTKEVLKWLRSEFEGVPIYWARGNHDRRWELYLQAKAPELLGIGEFELSYIFGCDALNIKVLDDKTKVMAGNLHIMHGDTLLRGFGTSVSPARSIFLKTSECVLAGHCHKSSEFTSMSMDGNITTCWTTGCLNDLEPFYNPHISGYNHGFAIVSFNRDGSFSVQNKRIHNYRIL